MSDPPARESPGPNWMRVARRLWVVYPATAAISIVDLGAGTGLLTEVVARAFPAARFVLIDLAAEMLEVARRRFAGDGAADRDAERFLYVVADYAQADLLAGTDAVISGLSVHHLSDRAKARLFARIHAALRPGGVFVNAEQVLGETPGVERENQHWWLAETKRAGVSDEDLAAAMDRMKADRMAMLGTQLAWLREAGFRDVRSTYRNRRFAVYRGTR